MVWGCVAPGGLENSEAQSHLGYDSNGMPNGLDHPAQSMSLADYAGHKKSYSLLVPMSLLVVGIPVIIFMTVKSLYSGDQEDKGDETTPGKKGKKAHGADNVKGKGKAGSKHHPKHRPNGSDLDEIGTKLSSVISGEDDSNHGLKKIMGHLTFPILVLCCFIMNLIGHGVEWSIGNVSIFKWFDVYGFSVGLISILFFALHHKRELVIKTFALSKKVEKTVLEYSVLGFLAGCIATLGSFVSRSLLRLCSSESVKSHQVHISVGTNVLGLLGVLLVMIIKKVTIQDPKVTENIFEIGIWVVLTILILSEIHGLLAWQSQNLSVFSSKIGIPNDWRWWI